ncbi:MAG: NB-ARC domain-containing protein [Chitinophagales bacterium]
MPEITLAQIKSELYPHLQTQGFENAKIAQVVNTINNNGNHNINFQDLNNTTVNLMLNLNNDIDIEKLSRQIGRYLHPPKKPKWLGQEWRQSAIFVGRKQEIQDIETQLQEQRALVLMNGIGGTGKTSLAYQIMEQPHCLYNHFIWTNCQNAAETNENVLLNVLLYDSIQLHQDLQIAEDLKVAKTETQRWAILINAIKQLEGEVLWVIDNARKNDAEYIGKLPRNCKILLTSRHEINGLNTYRLNELAPNDALQLFRTHYKRKDETAVLQKICETVGYHALTIELLARTLHDLDGKNAAYLLQQLQENGLNIKRKIAVWTNYTKKDLYLNDCLLFAFKIRNLKNNTPIHPLLQLFTLLPYQATPLLLLKGLLQIKTEEAEDEIINQINELRKLGWIKQEAENAIKPNQEGYMMHPVIQEYVAQQLPLKQEMKEQVVELLRGITWDFHEQRPIKAQVFKPYVEYIATKTKLENKNKAWLYNRPVTL